MKYEANELETSFAARDLLADELMIEGGSRNREESGEEENKRRRKRRQRKERYEKIRREK